MALSVAESWLVEDGEVCALDRHRSRFLAAVAQQAWDCLPRAKAAWEGFSDEIPLTGRWFPRIGLREDGSVEKAVRPAPEPRSWARVYSGPSGVTYDPRRNPLVKGSDLDALSRLRQTAHARGLDEHLLTTPDGHLIECAHSSVLWWDGDDLCLPSEELRPFPRHHLGADRRTGGRARPPRDQEAGAVTGFGGSGDMAD